MSGIRLRNGAFPVVHHSWMGRRGQRRHLGLVLAKTNGLLHEPYVTWLMASDDGDVWDCFSGDYCSTVGKAFRSYGDRRRMVPNG